MCCSIFFIDDNFHAGNVELHLEQAQSLAGYAAVIVPIHLIDSNIILPFLVGSRVRVNAFITFFAIVAGGLIWGIAGMFLSIPLTAVVKIIFDHVEALGHWGFLFGDDEKPARKIFQGRKKSDPAK